MAYTRRTRVSQVTYIPDDISGSASATHTAFPAEILNYGPPQITPVGGGLQAGSGLLTAPVNGDEHTVISFRRLLLPHDTDGEVPSWGPLARAAGMAEGTNGTPPNSGFKYTLDELTKPQLDTDSTAGSCDPIDIWLNVDRLKTLAKSCVGNCIFTFNAGDVPTIQFDGMGIVNNDASNVTASTEGALAAVDVSYDETGVGVSDADFQVSWNSNTYSSLVCPGMTIDLGANIVLQPSVDAIGAIAQPLIAGWNPTCTFMVRDTDFATVNWESIWRNANRTVTARLSHQDGGGDRIDLSVGFTGALMQFPTPVEQDGILYRQIVLGGNAADNTTEVSLSYQGT